MNRGLEVALCKNVRSYTKLYPALCNCPDSDVITIDDDIMYKYDLVESLVNTHRNYGDCIVAHRTHRIILGTDGLPAPYTQWGWGGYYETPTFLNFFTGVGGTYYPARSLDMEVYNADVFQDICPFADDVWFNAMAVKNGTRTVRAQAVNPCGEDYIENIEVQNAALCKLNVDHGLNDRQLRAVLGKYNLYGTLADEYRRVCQENVKKF